MDLIGQYDLIFNFKILLDKMRVLQILSLLLL